MKKSYLVLILCFFLVACSAQLNKQSTSSDQATRYPPGTDVGVGYIRPGDTSGDTQNVLPDLTISIEGFDIEELGTQARVEVSNKGGSAEHVVVAIFVGSESEQRVINLPAASSQELTIPLPELAVGIITLTAKIDPFQTIDESSEQNNQDQVTVTFNEEGQLCDYDYGIRFELDKQIVNPEPRTWQVNFVITAEQDVHLYQAESWVTKTLDPQSERHDETIINYDIDLVAGETVEGTWDFVFQELSPPPVVWLKPRFCLN